MFVAIEGIEGSGKSTLLAELAERLRSEGLDVLATREPGGTPVGDAVRDVFLNRALAIAPLTESMLVSAARAQHVVDVIRPALGAGRFVLCDRFTDSTLAYQGYGRRVRRDVLRALCEMASDGLQPDFVLVVDLPVAVARERLRARSTGMDRIENEDDGFHERVRQGFLELATSPRHRVLDGTLAPEQLAALAMDEIRARRGAPR